MNSEVASLIEESIENQYAPNLDFFLNVFRLDSLFFEETFNKHPISDKTIDYGNGRKLVYTQHLHDQFMMLGVEAAWRDLKSLWMEDYHDVTLAKIISLIKISDKIVDALEMVKFEYRMFHQSNHAGDNMMHMIGSLYLREKNRILELEPIDIDLATVDKFDELGAFVLRSYGKRWDWNVCDHIHLMGELYPAAIANALDREIDKYYETECKKIVAKDLRMYSRIRQTENAHRKGRIVKLFNKAKWDMSPSHFASSMTIADANNIVNPKRAVLSLKK